MHNYLSDPPDNDCPSDVVHEHVLAVVKHGVYRLKISENECRDSEYNHMFFECINERDPANSIQSDCLLDTCIQIGAEYNECPLNILKEIVDLAVFKNLETKEMAA